jgi:hypothetical protein
MTDAARIQALEQQLQALQDQLAAAPAQAQQPVAQVVAPQPGPFALTPALATQDVIDYRTPQGAKLYKSITTPLDAKFDGSAQKLILFMDELRHKADQCGWNDLLLNVSDQHPITPTNRNLLIHHRLITIDNVRAHAITYIGTQSRVAQDSHMMYVFLNDSLTEGAKARMASEHANYDINGVSDGPSYLKTLLDTYFVETIATNFLLRQKLQALPTALKRCKYDVGDFNKHVNDLLSDLYSGGETTTDMMVNLFTAYLSVKDQAFHTYIAHKKEQYDEGTSQLTPVSLMSLARTKYNLLTTQEVWMKKSIEEENLVALNAQLKKTKAKMAKLANDSNTATEHTPTTERPAERGTWLKTFPQWHFENPDGLASIFKDGKQWYWCKWHKCFVRHKEPNCNKHKARDKKAKQATTDPKARKTKNTSKTKALTLAKALLAMSNADDGEESISEDEST